MPARPRRIALAAVPLLIALLAFATWQVTDRLQYVGPISRGWIAGIVVIPMWLLAPAAAGIAWRFFDARARLRMAAAAGVVVAAGIGAFFWWSAVSVDCRPSHSPLELIGPAAAMGLVVGGGFGLACLWGSGDFARRDRRRSVASAVGLQLLTSAIAYSLSFSLFFGLCARP